MKISITETQYNNLLLNGYVVNEGVNLSGYQEEDFIEVFLTFFRPWVKQKHGDEIGSHPFSILLDKYIEEFSKDFGIYYYQYGGRVKKMVEAGKELVKKGRHSLPTLRPSKKFTEQHNRALNIATKLLNLPSYVTLNFTEEDYYEVQIETKIDFLTAIKDTSVKNPLSEANKFTNQIKNFITDTMGIQVGNPVEGKLKIMNYTNIVGFDKWLLNFNKTFKKEVKEKFKNTDYRGMKVSLNNTKVEIKLSFARYTSYRIKDSVSTFVKEKIKEEGYNTNVFYVTYP